jgi:hypothetical protein
MVHGLIAAAYASRNQWRYALVFLCSVSTAANFVVSVSFVLSLSCTDDKYLFVAACIDINKYKPIECDY